ARMFANDVRSAKQVEKALTYRPQQHLRAGPAVQVAQRLPFEGKDGGAKAGQVAQSFPFEGKGGGAKASQ
ncbi:unnamed protein product, partial [Prorocentrum cordatum]